MSISLRFLCSLILLATATSSAAGVAAAEPSVHDLLPEYGLPPGLLPDSVKSYSLSGNGEFEVELKAPCYVHFSNLVYYDEKIKGKLSYGSISDLQGIQAKKLFIWVSVTGIVAKPSDGIIEFEVGFLSESLPYKEFEVIPTCTAKAACRGSAGFLDEALPISEV